jgi:hypothetical protein
MIFLFFFTWLNYYLLSNFEGYTWLLRTTIFLHLTPPNVATVPQSSTISSTGTVTSQPYWMGSKNKGKEIEANLGNLEGAFLCEIQNPTFINLDPIYSMVS